MLSRFGFSGGPVIHRALAHLSSYIAVTRTIPCACQTELRPVRTIGEIQAGLNLGKTANYAGKDRGALQDFLVAAFWESWSATLRPKKLGC